MADERQRWLSAAEADKRQHFSLILTANDLLKQISGRESNLSTTSSPEDVSGALKQWSDWWQGEVAKMGKP